MYLPVLRLEPTIQLKVIILAGQQLVDQQLAGLQLAEPGQQQLEFLIIELEQFDRRQLEQLMLPLHQQC